MRKRNYTFIFIIITSFLLISMYILYSKKSLTFVGENENWQCKYSTTRITNSIVNNELKVTFLGEGSELNSHSKIRIVKYSSIGTSEATYDIEKDKNNVEFILRNPNNNTQGKMETTDEKITIEIHLDENTEKINLISK